MTLGIGDRRALANLIAQALVGKVYQNEHELTGIIAKLLDEFLGPINKTKEYNDGDTWLV